uniref:Transglutaminase 5, like n=1 Tax=Cyprinodon variegatus TaxID=28743 RepID=A0A3Q2D8P5_CYPVA
IADLSIKYVNLELAENLQRHRTNGFSNTEALVVRRGAPFQITVQLKGRPFDPRTDSVRIKVTLGRLYAVMPVTFSGRNPSSRWNAYIDPNNLDFQRLSIFVSSPASASVGRYKFQLYVSSQDGQRSAVVGDFTMLCNPWCSDDAVYIPFEDQREEYVLSDSGLLFMGTPLNLIARPWSFDLKFSKFTKTCFFFLSIQYEPVSPQHIKNKRKDYMNRANPVYISRVVSAMINSEDDRGVLKGNWTDDFKQGVSPSRWTGSGDILRLWAKSGYSPVKYGQCWVFAAVMCTVMRVLGIPCRVITNFNSAHDTNGNLVIEEYYSETGQKLNRSQDSIWNFHVWVECWMRRTDLGQDMDGWQVLDPTPQQRSGGVFCCGPAPVKGIRNQRTDLIYDIPFVYSSVNADVHTIILSGQDHVVGFSKDTEKVGSLICTKAVGYPRMQNITGDYKYLKSTIPKQNMNAFPPKLILSTSTSKGVTVFLTLTKSPVAGEPIVFLVKVMNKQKRPKMMNIHLNAQAKEYNHSPSETFWEKHGAIQLAPMEGKSISLSSGILTVAGAGLIAASQTITLIPNMAGVKMLQASLSLLDTNITIRGFKMISINSI